MENVWKIKIKLENIWIDLIRSIYAPYTVLLQCMAHRWVAVFEFTCISSAMAFFRSLLRCACPMCPSHLCKSDQSMTAKELVSTYSGFQMVLPLRKPVPFCMVAQKHTLPSWANEMWSLTMFTETLWFVVRWRTVSKLFWSAGTCRTCVKITCHAAFPSIIGANKICPLPAECTTLFVASLIGTQQSLQFHNQCWCSVIWFVAPVSVFQHVSALLPTNDGSVDCKLAFPVSSCVILLYAHSFA